MLSRSVDFVIVVLFLQMAPVLEAQIFQGQGSMVGEVTRTSAILQSRLTASKELVDGDVSGVAGVARFEYSTDKGFKESRKTNWIKADASYDFIVKTKVSGLQPATQYFYRLVYGAVGAIAAKNGPVGTFRTLQKQTGVDEVSFVVVTGMNYVSFYHGKLGKTDPATGFRKRDLATGYQGDDKAQGFPALESIRKLKPTFFVGTGDNIYYDSHDAMEATTLVDMRRKWHQQFRQPRFIELFRQVPIYWEKDDHDHRFDDCDREGTRPPLSDLGIATFREQVPVVDPTEPGAKTYRTHRINRHLQIWLVEGRDYRSPNKMKDGPEKVLWGAEQIAWLKKTLLASDATFKLLISPTPLVGPDDARKKDNHTNINGFQHEGREFFKWVVANRLHEQGFYTLCGDRHWQYHARHPLGVEEFSCGALVDSNSRLGRKPGDPQSTDPEAKIRQIYTQKYRSGGFLRVVITSKGTARFEFYDENGKELYRAVKEPHANLSVLGEDASGLLEKYYLKRIHAQYDKRRAEVAEALKTKEGVLQRQQVLRRHLRRVLGDLPEKTALRARVTGKIEGDGYRIEKVVYESRPGHYVTANLYVPTVGKAPFPGVLIACGHSNLGKAYDMYHRAGLLMVKQGFLTLVYDCIGQGERSSYLSGTTRSSSQHKLDHVNAILVGRTVVGYQAWDSLRSADYLLSRPEVDRTKPLGMTGNSGGGGQTMYLMALDDRIGPAAPSCHITTIEREFEQGKCGDGCQTAPFLGMLGIDHGDFFTMRSPKPSIILSAEQDYKDIRFTRVTFKETQRVYELLDHPERMDMFAYDDKHAFSKPRRQAAARWMSRWLLEKNDPVIEPEMKTYTPEQLKVTNTGQVLSEYSQAVSVSSLNLRKARELAADRQAFWNSRSQPMAMKEISALVGVKSDIGEVRVERKGRVDRGDYRIEKLVLQRPGEMPVPALLFLPKQLKGKHAATLYVDARGKATDASSGGEIEQLVAEGQIVLSIDVRGFGETKDAKQKVAYYTSDFRSGMWSLHIGQTLLGQRVEDTFAGLRFLTGHEHVDVGAIRLVGIKQAGPVVLHAASLNPGFSAVALRDSIRSWVDDVVAGPLQTDVIGHVVPHALKKYDLPDLAERLGEKLTVE
jgi:alkaline phosphatase D